MDKLTQEAFENLLTRNVRDHTRRNKFIYNQTVALLAVSDNRKWELPLNCIFAMKLFNQGPFDEWDYDAEATIEYIVDYFMRSRAQLNDSEDFRRSNEDQIADITLGKGRPTNAVIKFRDYLLTNCQGLYKDILVVHEILDQIDKIDTQRAICNNERSVPPHPNECLQQAPILKRIFDIYHTVDNNDPLVPHRLLPFDLIAYLANFNPNIFNLILEMITNIFQEDLDDLARRKRKMRKYNQIVAENPEKRGTYISKIIDHNEQIRFLHKTIQWFDTKIHLPVYNLNAILANCSPRECKRYGKVATRVAEIINVV